jgi:hypothetical protein
MLAANFWLAFFFFEKWLRLTFGLRFSKVLFTEREIDMHIGR